MLNASSSKTTEAQPATKGEPSTRRGGWGPMVAVIFVVFIFFGTQFVGGLLLSLYTTIRGWDVTQANFWLDNSVSAQFLFVLFTEVCIVALLWFFLHFHKANFRSIGFTKPKWIDGGLMLLGAGAYVALYIVTIGVLGAVVNIDVTQEQQIGFDNVVGAGALAMTFVSLVVLPPLVEELTFRGLLFTSLRKSWGFIGAAIGTSILFAMPHLLQGGDQRLLWIAGVDTLVLSLVLCFLREKTGRLWAGIGVHAIKNMIAFVSLFILHVR